MFEVLMLFCDKFAQFCRDYEWIGSKSLFLLTPSFNEYMDALSNDIGMDSGTLKYVIMLIAAYPLATIFSALPNPVLKNSYSFLVGLWMMQNIFLSQWIHSVITAAVTYLFMLTLPNSIMPKVVFVFLLTYLCCSHLYRMYVDYMGWSLDFTGPQMLFTMKLSTLAYNVADGQILDKLMKSTGNSKKDSQNQTKVLYAITKVPSLLTYLGYTYCFVTVLAGPAFEYKEYIDSVTGKSYICGTDEKMNGKKISIPPRIIPVLSKFFFGLCCLAIYQIGSMYLPIDVLVSAEVLAMPPIRRYALSWVALFFCRQKYYFAWKVTNGASILCGFGYEGKDKNGKHKWDGIDTVDIYGFETAENMTGNTRSWNKMAQNWLERYVYARTNNSLTATYFVSAFWHGFYPGYYLFFMSLPLAQQTLRVARKNISPHFYSTEGLRIAYHYGCIVMNSIIVNYMVMPFQMLSWERSTTVWGSYYYGIHIAIILTYILAKYIIRPPKMVRPMESGAAKKTS